MRSQPMIQTLEPQATCRVGVCLAALISSFGRLLIRLNCEFVLNQVGKFAQETESQIGATSFFRQSKDGMYLALEPNERHR